MLVFAIVVFVTLVAASPGFAQREPRWGVRVGATSYDFVHRGTGTGVGGALRYLVQPNHWLGLEGAVGFFRLPEGVVQGDIRLSPETKLVAEAGVQLGHRLKAVRGYVGAGAGGVSPLESGEFFSFRRTFHGELGIESIRSRRIIPGLEVRKRWFESGINNDVNDHPDRTIEIQLGIRF